MKMAQNTEKNILKYLLWTLKTKLMVLLSRTFRKRCTDEVGH